MEPLGNLTERALIIYSLYIYGKRFLNILVIGAIVSLALTGIAATLIYGLGWEEHIPINTTWPLVNDIDRSALFPKLLIGNSYLDSYYVFYNYPGYFFFTFFWTTSSYISFFPGVVFVIISILAGSLTSAVAIRIIAQHMAKRRVGIGITSISSLKRVGRYILVNSAYWFLIVSLINTVFGIPLAVFIAFKWMFAGHAVLFEDAGIKDSIRRSAYIFDNNWLQSATYVFFLAIIAIIVAGGMALIPIWGSPVGIMLSTLIPPVFVTVYYVTLRIEREAYDANEFTVDLDSWAVGIKPVHPKRASREAKREQTRERWSDFMEERKGPRKM